ncbi:resuscitation-promoting factor [Cellulomonas alba]|uniref:Transglycosylase family protein n=1 Tax=Cellulomonas alba TaxID=3053467 RepID=A0ABT7SHA4_9CELL|nr:resuscitation-promoting factor [Cellulomonas alba]MDM7855555.1 transglycosylase family protein [Cellulomonas alba]
MPFTTRLTGPFTRRNDAEDAPTTGAAHATTTRRDRWSGRRVVPVAATAAVLVAAGGTAAYAHADKSVTLDVDGTVRHVHTFAGSVHGLLADRHVTVGEHDAVTASDGLRDGSEVVVRHGHQVTVLLDGQERTVWTTALSADDALETLAARDADVRLVASRSQTNGRPELALDLTVHGPAQIVVDGRTVDVVDADASVSQVLTEQGVTLGPLDRVSVQRTADGTLQVIVNRVSIDQVTTHKAIAFDTTKRKDPAHYTGITTVVAKGAKGERTTVTQVTTVDGKVTARHQVSTAVTRKPVDRVLAVGTKERPVAQPTVTHHSTTSSSGSSRPAKSGGKASGLNWSALARCESGGRVNAVSSNGLYYGLYQFSVGTWRAVGGSGLPSQASASEQTARAQELYNRSGAGQWPVCGKYLFS